MPRDANGNYTLPAGNPVVTGTVITSTWANNTMTDVGSELTDSLSRSGKGGFTAPVGIVDKSGSVPGLNFVSEPTSGFKREASEDLRVQVTATDVWQGIKTGVKVLTPGSGGVLKHPVVEESGQKVMRGVGGTTKIWFFSATVPVGWTPDVSTTFAHNLVTDSDAGASGGTYIGTQNPAVGTLDVTVTNVSVDLPANTGGHALTDEENGPHFHSVGAGAYSTGPTGYRSEANQQNNGPQITGTSGAGVPHTHPLGGTAAQTVGSGTGSTAAFEFRAAVGIIGTLDA